MYILFFAPNYLPHIGGVEKHISFVSNELIKDGHNVTIITVKSNKEYDDFESNGLITIFRIRRTIHLFNSVKMVYFILCNYKIVRRANILHFHDFSTFWNWGLPLFPFLKISGKKLYLTFHGWEGHIPPKKINVIKRQICTFLVNGNITVGHFIEKWYKTKASIINYGGVERVVYEKQKTKKKIVFVGRLESDTGILLYLKAWEIFLQEHPEYQFDIYGDGRLRFEIEDIINERKISSTAVKGFIENPASCYQDAEIIFTSGYLGILEAFYCKIPVITVYDNSLKEDYLRLMPGSSNMMWIENSVAGILNAMKEALVDNEKVSVAFDFAEKNSWGKIKDDYYKLWNVA